MHSNLAVVEAEQIGENTTIMEFAIIRKGACIGKNVVIHPHVIIASNAVVGDGTEIFPGAVIGKEPNGAGAVARPPTFDKHLRIGENCSIGPHAVIYYDVEIANNTLVGDGASIREQCRIGSFCVIGRHVAVLYNASIGDHTKIMDNTVVTGNCRIGNNVFVSLTVGMANDNLIGKGGEYREATVKGPTIDDGAIIGAGATLLPGINIGRNAVVAAGSVVTRDVAPETVVMGAPARFVRKNQGN